MALATLSIDLEAKLARLEDDMGKASRIAEQHASRMEKAFASVRAAGAAIGAAVAGSLSVSAFTDFVRDSAEAAERIERLSQLAGSSAGEFQRYAAGAKSVGMDMDKFSDVMKDVQDKVGDFLATGGGELKDFFEQVAPKVGVTADQFRTLSGPQALQLFYTTLERANVGSKEMVFFLESIADDASTLAPLLRGNGAGFAELAAKAEAAGVIMSDKVVKDGVELNKQLKEMQANVDGLSNSIASALIPRLNKLAEAFKGKGFLANMAEGYGDMLKWGMAQGDADEASARFQKLVADIERYQGMLKDDPGNRQYQQRLDRLIARLPEVRAEAERTAEALKRAINGPLPDAAGNRSLLNQSDAALRGVTTSSGAWRPKPEKKNGEKSEYDREIERLNAAIAGTLDLSNAEQVRYDIATGKLSGLNKAQEEYLVGLAKTLDVLKQPSALVGPEIDPELLKQRADEQKRLNDMLADMPTFKLELARKDMELLAKAFDSGQISAEQFSEAASARLGNLPDEVKPALDEMDERMKEFGRNVQDALGDSIENTLRGNFDSIGELWANLLVKMGSQALAAQLGNLVFGDMFKPGGGSNYGLIGKVGNWLFSADGNAFDAAGRITAFADGGIVSQATPFTYGRGQLGVMGEAGEEGILPLRRGANGKLGVIAYGSSGSVVINPVYNIGQGVSRSEVVSAISAANNQLRADILRSQRRQGAFAQ